MLLALAEDRVPAILDGIVGAAGEEIGDGGPAVAVGGLVLDDEHVLLDGEGLDGLHPGVEVLAPAEAARLGVAAGQPSADGVPVVRAAAAPHLLPQQVVLLLGPHLLDPVRRAVTVAGAGVVARRRHHHPQAWIAFLAEDGADACVRACGGERPEGRRWTRCGWCGEAAAACRLI